MNRTYPYCNCDEILGTHTHPYCNCDEILGTHTHPWWPQAQPVKLPPVDHEVGWDGFESWRYVSVPDCRIDGHQWGYGGQRLGSVAQGMIAYQRCTRCGEERNVT